MDREQICGRTGDCITKHDIPCRHGLKISFACKIMLAVELAEVLATDLEDSRMVRNLTRNQAPGNRLRVRIPCPPLMRIWLLVSQVRVETALGY